MKEQAVRTLKDISFNSEDTLIIFGEVFPGGYVNGLIQEAKARGMNIIYSTVGRRTPEDTLRPLTTEELQQMPSPLINVPLEAGFDKENSNQGTSAVELCRNIKLQNWEETKLDKTIIKSAQQKASDSFRKRTQSWLTELKTIIPSSGNIIIAHTMAGGVPRTKIFLPILNRVLKGTDKRYSSSEAFWNSDLGWLCQENFSEVTAKTFHHLIDLSSSLREELKKQNRKIFYTAYSYHGTEVLINNHYQWQSYAPYLQGFAKVELENISKEYFKEGIKTCVFNVPEILTKSSAIFPGVEIPLYPLLGALKKEGERIKLLARCEEKLQKEAVSEIMNITKEYFLSDTMTHQLDFTKWPQHNTPEQMALMLNTSRKLADLHRKENNITQDLSLAILNSCGRLILQEISHSEQAVSWLGHDIIARDLIKHK